MLFNEVVVRAIVDSDLEEILLHEKRCWSANLVPRKEKLEAYLEHFPSGQLVACYDNKIIGTLFSQRISSFESLSFGSFVHETKLHCEHGTLLQICSIAVDKDMQLGNIACLLRDFVVEACRNLSEHRVSKIVALTRCSSFKIPPDTSHDEMNAMYEKYVFAGRDPTIFFHLSGGGKIIQLVPGYRPEDVENLGHAVLIEYDFLHVRLFELITKFRNNFQFRRRKMKLYFCQSIEIQLCKLH